MHNAALKICNVNIEACFGLSWYLDLMIKMARLLGLYLFRYKGRKGCVSGGSLWGCRGDAAVPPKHRSKPKNLDLSY